MTKLKEYAAVCTVGSMGYSLIEIVWRGFTHWTMAVTGGIGFLLLYLTNLRMAGKTLLSRCAAGCAVLTSVEFLAGCIVNKLFGPAGLGLFKGTGKPDGAGMPVICNPLVFALCAGDAVGKCHPEQAVTAAGQL